MARLNGGELLLDLTSIELEQSVDVETYTNITDSNIIEQLTNLKRYIHDEKSIKPVYIKLVNKETDEIVVVKGSLSKLSGVEEFYIDVLLNGFRLKIHVEFTQMELEDNTPIDDWFIDTNDAKYLFVSEEQYIGTIIGQGDIENAKPIYWHTLHFQRGGTPATSAGSRLVGYMIVLSNTSTPLTLNDFKDLLRIQGFVGVLINAKASVNGAEDLLNMDQATRITYNDGTNFTIHAINPSTNEEFLVHMTIDTYWILFEDLGVNKIN